MHWEKLENSFAEYKAHFCEINFTSTNKNFIFRDKQNLINKFSVCTEERYLEIYFCEMNFYPTDKF